MRIFSDFSEFKAAVGSEVGASEWIKVTQERINLFAQATCDEQWIHVDEERAKKELPGGIWIMGELTCALSMTGNLVRHASRMNIRVSNTPPT